LSDLPGLVPPALPRWAMPLVLWRTCPRVTYFPPPPKALLKQPGTKDEHTSWNQEGNNLRSDPKISQQVAFC